MDVCVCVCESSDRRKRSPMLHVCVDECVFVCGYVDLRFTSTRVCRAANRIHSVLFDYFH